MDFASSHQFLSATYVHPVRWPASLLLTGFKAFFTLVLLQQLFASVRRGKVLSETIAEFWSPHEPIAERARLSLPQHGVGAVRPLLASLRSIEFLTKEQRDQLPRVLADIGPSALPTLTAHLHDSHENVRAVAAGAVGCLHDLDALPALVRLRRDPSEWVRESLVEALGKIGGANGSKVRRRRRRLLGRALGAPSRLMAWVIWKEGVGAGAGRGRPDRPGRLHPARRPGRLGDGGARRRPRGARTDRPGGGRGGPGVDRHVAGRGRGGSLSGGRIAGQGGRAAGDGGRGPGRAAGGREPGGAGGGGPDAGVAERKGGGRGAGPGVAVAGPGGVRPPGGGGGRRPDRHAERRTPRRRWWRG